MTHEKPTQSFNIPNRIDDVLDVSDPEILTSLGNALCQRRQFDEAIDAYQRAASVDPGYSDAWQNLAVVYQLQGDIESAVQACERYLELQPDDGQVQYNLGLMYKDLGREADAIRAFVSAEHYLDPVDADSATCLGASRLFQDEPESAFEAFGLALQFDPDHLPARYYSGVCKLMLGEVDQAIKTLEDVVDRAPDYPQAAENLAVAYLTAGRPDRAVPLLESLADRDNVAPSVAKNLAIAYEDLGMQTGK